MRTAMITILVALGLACTRVEDPPATAQEIEGARRLAREGVQKLVSTLMAELSDALDAGPPEQAMEVCSRSAAKLTEVVAGEKGITIRRTALRVRNPANAPLGHEREVLERWLTLDDLPDHDGSVVVADDGQRSYRYLVPIVMPDFCVTCHGTADEIPDAVKEALARLYPDDAATGFRPGELRGAVSVTVPLARSD